MATSENIYWRDALKSGMPIVDEVHFWTCDGAVCFWHGQEALEAHTELGKANQHWEQQALMAYTDKETGIVLIPVSSGAYIDFGLKIEDQYGNELFYNPCYLSRESYGYVDEDDDGNELEEGVAWARAQWWETLRDQFDDLVDGSVGWEKIDDETGTLKTNKSLVMEG